VSELLQKLNPEQVTGIIIVLSLCLAAATAFVAVQWRKVRLAEQETALKQEMLRQGVPAAEVVRVVTATRHGGPPAGPPPAAAPVRETAV
jgi:hypothetical protein